MNEGGKKTIRAYALKDGRVIRESELQRYAIQKESKQLPKDAETWYTHDKLVKPPYGPFRLLQFYESNPYHAACCQQIAADILGAGWTLDPIKGDKGNEEEKARIERFLDKPNPKAQGGLQDVLEPVLTDHESIGWRALEVVRAPEDSEGEAELFHVPAQTLRVHKDGMRYRQAWSQYSRKRRWFKLFGIEETVSNKTGEIKKDMPEKEQAGELIVRHKYTSSSTFYGVPAAIPALGAILGMGEVRDYNLAFFQNHAVPEFMLIFEGQDELTEEERENIERMLRETIKGSQNQHKTLTLTSPEGVKVRVEKLGAEIREASFRLYNATQVEQILVAHRMPPYRIGIEKVGALGGSNTREATEMYKASVIQPRKKALAADINLILREVLDIKTWAFRFNEMDTRDRQFELEQWQAFFAMGAANPNQIIKHFDLGEEYEGGKQYYVNNVPVGQLPTTMSKAGKNGRGLLEVLRNLQAGVREELEMRNRMMERR